MDYTSDNEAALSRPYQHLVNHSPWLTSSVSNSINYNTLDTQSLPHEGIIASFTQELAGLGGDSDFYKVSAKGRIYYTLSDDMDLVGSLSGAAGHVISTTGKPLNIFDQFSLDSNDIRGFADTGIGPRMKKNDDPLGGTTYYGGSAEVQFPIFGLPKEIGLKGALFADAGSVFDYEGVQSLRVAPGKKGVLTVNAEDDNKIRSSVGASLLWQSPLGPIRFDFAKVLSKAKYDETQVFRFSGGTRF